MKKYCLLFIGVLTLFAQSEAQYYNKRIVKDAWATTYNSCVLIGDTLYVSGIYGWKNAIQNQKPLICKYTLSGELVKQFFFIGDTLRDYGPLQSLIYTKEKNLVSVCYGAENGTQQYGVICTSDASLHLDSVQKLTDTARYSFTFSKIIELGDSSLICTGYSGAKTGWGKPTLLKLRKDRSKEWNKYVGIGQKEFYYPTCLTVRTNGRIVLIAERTIYYPDEIIPTRISVFQVVFELDQKTGNILKTAQLPSDSIFGSVCLIPTMDGGFITGNAKADSFSQKQLVHHGYISKLDSNYNMIWRKQIISSYGNSHFNTIKQLADGNYLGIGECVNFDSDTTVPFSNPLKSLYAGWLVKFNEAGDIIWDRKYYGVASYQEFNRLFDFAELPNGDIIACGESTNMYNDDNFTQDSILQMGWLLRIGPDGCLSGTNCGYTSIAVPQENKTIELSIYPNPAVDKINIETNALDDTENYSFVVTDLTGKAITNPVRLFQHSSYIVNAANYSSGSYIVSVFHHQQLLFSKKIEKL